MPVSPLFIRRQYVALLQRLLAIRDTNLTDILTKATTLLANAFQADKVDCFLYDAPAAKLVAIGASETPLAQRQRELGLDRLALDHAGRVGVVFLHNQPFVTGASHQDPEEIPEVIELLGIRSTLAVPLLGEHGPDGVLSVTSMTEALYGRADLEVLEAIGHWIQLLRHRQQLMDQLLYTPPTGQLPTSEETIAQLTRECARLRAEMLFWQSTADELIMELSRRQPGSQGTR